MSKLSSPSNLDYLRQQPDAGKPIVLTKVDFPTFVNMTHLNVNCLYLTLNKVNEKIDYLYNNLGNELIDISKVRKINNEMEQIQKDCQEKFINLRNSLKENNKSPKS